MLIKSKDTYKKKRESMIIHAYKINSNFSGSLIEINWNHGKIKCIKEERIYFIIKGKGKFILNEEEHSVSANDLVFVPKNTPYNIIGKMKYFLICSPAFNPKDDIRII